MASYLMNGNDISTDLPSFVSHLPACLSFFFAFAFARCIQSEKTHSTAFIQLLKHNREEQISSKEETNAACFVGSHCHTGVECRSSTLIVLEAHDPVSKVKGHFWCDFCCQSSKLAKLSPTQVNLSQGLFFQCRLLNFFKLLYENSKGFQMRMSQLQVAFSAAVKHR